MKRNFLMSILLYYFLILIALQSVGCSTFFTSTRKPLKLINGEFDACLLVNSSEIETVLDVEVVGETMFSEFGVECEYRSLVDDKLIFFTTVATDATLEKNNDIATSAMQAYDIAKIGQLQMESVLKIEDIDNFGDQAFSSQGYYIQIYVLKNQIFYIFNAVSVDSGGIGYDALMKLAKIALERMP